MSNLFRSKFKFKNGVGPASMDFRRQTRLIEWALRLFLGGTFIFSSWHKIVSPDQFATILYGYAVFPHPSINILAIVVPFVELVCGISLITGLLKRSGLLLINAMLAGFIFLISFNLIRGHEFDCGCFSLGETKGTWTSIWLLVRDLVMLGAGIYLFRLFDKKDRG
ncbi:MauE/DoxX family redox-associated membrane protein [Desulfobacter latus]|uniref:DoxX family membrane protein n=1 Tax=Desulfobacter latus TaxID=2292 RepID=A0A850T109_9BACT|nr:MauE/DoxX family redox-associated membrane protein [Desulfobacter latus]NWH04781.1 DoxX family membrane protein [Desulfobacter latus]